MKLRYIILKDIKKIIYDKKLLAVIVVMPIILMTILGFSLRNMFGVSEGSVGGIKVAVVKNYQVDEDIIRFKSIINNSMMSLDDKTKKTIIDEMPNVNGDKILFDFLDSDDIQKILDYTVVKEIKAREMLSSKEVDAVIIVPQDYVYNTYMNYMMPVRNKVQIDILKNSDNNFKGSLVQGLVNSFIQVMNNYCLNREVFINQVTKYDNLQLAINGMSYLMDEFNDNLEINAISVNNINVEKKKNITSFQYYAAAIMAMFLLYSASTGGRFPLEEVKDITLPRERVAGVGKLKILASNFYMMVILCCIQSIIMIGYSKLILNINWGDMKLILFTVLVTSFAVGGIGVLISVLTLVTKDYKIANLFEFGVIQFMALIGGSFVPVEVLPKVIQKLSLFSINGVAIKMYTNIMRGVPLSGLLNYALILVGMGTLFITVATIIANRKGAI
ncbi:MAG: ABC transporter permease [Vallitalea sp.]|nr:ABC transporter permease [Vallitalea sp.]